MESYNVIISTLTFGFIWWLVGIENNDRSEKICGSIAVFISIILNFLSQIKII